jgi:lipooligosaccharide transport system ATP-binding protein
MTLTEPAPPLADQVMTMVEARGVVKRYPVRGGEPFTAVAGVDFFLKRGECFGVLGPNGAGKSTMMRMISCVAEPSEGSLSVLGLPTAGNGPRIRARIGVVPQDDALDRELTVRENMLVYGKYFRIPRAELRTRVVRLLDFARLSEKADQRVDELSGGMRRRLTIARALINEPELVLLDEPTTGLDPQARHVLWERLFQLKQRGVTQILTTHYMDEAEPLCDRLVVMDEGRIVDEGTPRELIERHCTREVLELRYCLADLPGMASRLLGDGESGEPPLVVTGPDDRWERLPDRLLLYTADGEAALAELHRKAAAPESALVRRSTLEDVFLKLTGRSLVD